MIKIGVIGCGAIAVRRHIPEYAANKKVRLVAFYDRTYEKAEKMAKQYNGNACHSIEELLAMDIDAVSVCTINRLHRDVSVQALEAKKHVLCEKPLAMSEEECRDMIDAAKKNKKILMVAQNQRFTPVYQYAKKAIEEGKIGTVLSFETRLEHSGPENWSGVKNTWFFEKRNAVMGVLADLGVHKTDLIRFLTGMEIVEIAASTSTMDKKQADGTLISTEDNAICIYTLENGATGTVKVSWTMYGTQLDSTIIMGNEGAIRCYDDKDYSFILERFDGNNEYLKMEKFLNNVDMQQGAFINSGMIDEFISSIEEGRRPESDGTEGYKSMRVILAALQAAKEKKTVKLDKLRDGGI